MNKSTQLHLSRLVRDKANYSNLARSLGISSRYLRRVKNEKMPQSCKRLIAITAKLLQLRQLLQQLQSAGVVTPAHLASAWAALRTDVAQNSAHPHAAAMPHIQKQPQALCQTRG